MEPVNGKRIGFVPGQFVFLHALDAQGKSFEKRPYSITSSPSPDIPYLEFCIKMLKGSFTGKLERMETGSTLGVEGPFGHFTYTGQKRSAFIAGGTGLAPFMSMLRHIAERRLGEEFILFYSAKTQADVAYGEELARLQKQNTAIRVIITLTQEKPAQWEGEYGRICEETIAKYVKDAGSFDWWICGPMAMVKGMKECLVGLKADPKRIRAEGWG